MNRDELIQSCKRILIATQSKRVKKLFYQNPMNQDIVIEKITNDDIKAFCSKMVNKFERYIEK